MKTILITNDDGFRADGLKALVKALKDIANVIVVAPWSEKSACSHSITLKSPMRFVKIDSNFYALEDGSPSDCIYLALHTMFKVAPPDLIISGINKGANLGEDTIYSGTVAGAMEGAIYGINSIAISQVMQKTDKGYDYSYKNATVFIKELVQKIFDKGFPLGDRKILNVNIPHIPDNKPLNGTKLTSLAYRLYGNDAHLHTNPRGDDYYWLGLHPLKFKDQENTDWNAIKNGFASITPLKINLTSTEDLTPLNEWI